MEKGMNSIIIADVPVNYDNGLIVQALQQFGRLKNYNRKMGPNLDYIYIDFDSDQDGVEFLKLRILQMDDDVRFRVYPSKSRSRIYYQPPSSTLRAKKPYIGKEYHVSGIMTGMLDSEITDTITKLIGPLASFVRYKKEFNYAFVRFSRADCDAKVLECQGRFSYTFEGQWLYMFFNLTNKDRRFKEPVAHSATIEDEEPSRAKEPTFPTESSPELPMELEPSKTERPSFSFTDSDFTDSSFSKLLDEPLEAEPNPVVNRFLFDMFGPAATPPPAASVPSKATVQSVKKTVVPDFHELLPLKQELTAKCLECSAFNLENFCFCSTCGVKRAFCRSCHSENIPGFKFCNYCGLRQ